MVAAAAVCFSFRAGNTFPFATLRPPQIAVRTISITYDAVAEEFSQYYIFS